MRLLPSRTHTTDNHKGEPSAGHTQSSLTPGAAAILRGSSTEHSSRSAGSMQGMLQGTKDAIGVRPALVLGSCTALALRQSTTALCVCVLVLK